MSFTCIEEPMTPFVLSISENCKLSVFIYFMRMLGLSIANVVHWLCIGVGNPLLKHDTVNSALSNAIKTISTKSYLFGARNCLHTSLSYFQHIKECTHN